MRTIPFQTIVRAVSDLCIKLLTICLQMSSVITGFTQREISTGREILQQCIKNANIAASEHIPICQDTGFAVFFVTMGAELAISEGTISEAINCGVEQGYEGYLRNSIVNDPLFDRKNTGNNTSSHLPGNRTW